VSWGLVAFTSDAKPTNNPRLITQPMLQPLGDALLREPLTEPILSSRWTNPIHGGG